ncbi:uncharacterized protein LOC142924589 isoform X2 [Petromyzon marinus]
MARWLAQLQEYNLQIEYRAGRTHANADALSRRLAVCAETRAEEACPCFTGGCCRQATAPQERAGTNPPPMRESTVCATETPAGGARDMGDHPAVTEPTPRGPTGRSTPPDRIQEDVGCAFPGLDDEQLRQTQQRDPDLAVVAAALREKKSALPGPWSDLLFGVPPPQQEEGSRPVERLIETLRGARGRAYPQGEAAHQRQEQGARLRMEPPFYSAGSKVPRTEKSRWSGGGDRRRNPKRWSHHPRGRPRGPGESRGPRGATSWGQPRRGAPVNPGWGLAPRGAVWCHRNEAAPSEPCPPP